MKRTPKCQVCKNQEATWAEQFIGENVPSWYWLGWHQRGWSVTKVCDQCKESYPDRLIEALAAKTTIIGGHAIPLDSDRVQQWIEAGLYNERFSAYFISHPEGETAKYTWVTRKVDELRNLKIWRK